MLNNIFDAFNKMPNPQAMELPYPEEAPDYTYTITGEELLQRFFNRYFIPEVYWNFWRRVTIVVDKTLSYPAGMVSQTKTLLLKPEYANPGILAHEFSHLSYYELNPNKKASFSSLRSDFLQFLSTLWSIIFILYPCLCGRADMANSESGGLAPARSHSPVFG